jgi:replicative DNA helicase
VHQRLYEAILKFAERGQTAGQVTLKNYFEKDGDLAHVGGAEYLADLVASVITTINAEHYGRTIYDLYMRRELIALCQDVLRDAYEPRLEQEHGAMAIIEQTEGRLFRLAETGDTGRGVQTSYEALRRAAEIAELAFNHDGGVTGVTTGFRSLDRRLGGLQTSDLIILAGRPSMGKTALAAIIGVMRLGDMRRWGRAVLYRTHFRPVNRRDPHPGPAHEAPARHRAPDHRLSAAPARH